MMRSNVMKCVLAGLFASAVFAQNSVPEIVDRVFNLTHTQNEQDLQEITVVIRSMADIREASADSARKSLTVHGTAAQIALAEWLFDELDKPIDRQQRQELTTREYVLAGDSEGVVRVFYLAPSETPQHLQEIATVIRSTADIRRAFTYTARRALMLRGTAAQMALAGWLFSELAKPAQGRHHAATRECQVSSDGDDMAGVFFTEHVTARDLQEVATLIRSIADIRRFFTYSAPRALTVRTTAWQMALAEWLFNELDAPVGSQPRASKEYLISGGNDGDNVVRVFHLTGIETPQRLQEFAVLVRSSTGIRRMFTYNTPKALVVRGTVEQVAAAERLVGEQVQPD